jgi:hypothetical protein
MTKKLTKDDLPDDARDILAIVERLTDQGNEGIKRQDIADGMGKAQLNAADLTHIEYLERMGLIESTRPKGATAWEYRLAPSGG